MSGLLAALPAVSWAASSVADSAAGADGAGAAASARLAVVRFAPEADYGPFVFQGPGGHIQGLSIDLLQRVAELGGLQVQTLPARPLAENLAAAQRGEVDLLSSLRPPPERAVFLGFTRPYAEVPAILVGPAGVLAPDLSALDGRAVAVGEGYAVEGFVRRRYPHVRWLAVRDDKVALQRLRAGTVAAVVADSASVAFIARQEGWTDLELGRPVGFRYALSFAYRKDRPAIGAALDKGLAALSPVEQQSLLARWIPPAAVAPRDSRLLGLSAIAMALLLGGVLLWVLRGRRSGLLWARRRSDIAQDDGAGA